jgi:hypothetical protein
MAKNRKIAKFAKRYSKEELISEAKRYLANAKETVQKSPIEFDVYQDPKYVSEACGIAYRAMQLALDAYFMDRLKEGEKKPESHEHYSTKISEIKDSYFRKLLLNKYIIVYDNIHLGGYYRFMTDTKVIKSGFDAIKTIIHEIEGKLIKKVA